MAVAGVRLVMPNPDQFSEERMHRNVLSLSIEYTTRDTCNSDQLSMTVVKGGGSRGARVDIDPLLLK